MITSLLLPYNYSVAFGTTIKLSINNMYVYISTYYIHTIEVLAWEVVFSKFHTHVLGNGVKATS